MGGLRLQSRGRAEWSSCVDPEPRGIRRPFPEVPNYEAAGRLKCHSGRRRECRNRQCVHAFELGRLAR